MDDNSEYSVKTRCIDAYVENYKIYGRILYEIFFCLDTRGPV